MARHSRTRNLVKAQTEVVPTEVAEAAVNSEVHVMERALEADEADEVDEVDEAKEAKVFQVVDLIKVAMKVPRTVVVEIAKRVVWGSWELQKGCSRRIT